MAVVNSEVLVFGSSNSATLTGSFTTYPIFIRLKQSDLSFQEGYSFQADSSILNKFDKCAASADYQVGI